MQLASLKACFAQLVRDGLASITKDEDTYYTFADHAGDMFCPNTNPEINGDDLKRQERNERARMNKQGAWFFTLVVKNEDLDSIGGFVGNDFYGSGYDTDFYRGALMQVKDTHPEYIAVRR